MAWQHYQMIRLAQEKHVMSLQFPDYEFLSPRENTFLLGNWRSSRKNDYRIRIDLPAAYPDECPSTYIVAPSPLMAIAPRTIESYGTSHDMHCWVTDKPGAAKICTFRSEAWSAQYTLAMVALKAQLWLEALEAHRTTGRHLAEFLLTWQQQ